MFCFLLDNDKWGQFYPIHIKLHFPGLHRLIRKKLVNAPDSPAGWRRESGSGLHAVQGALLPHEKPRKKSWW